MSTRSAMTRFLTIFSPRPGRLSGVPRAWTFSGASNRGTSSRSENRSRQAGCPHTSIPSILLQTCMKASLLFSSLNQKVRTDLTVPVWKMSAEFDVGFGEANVRQPDTNVFRSWEIAGTSHVDYHLRLSREPMELRDIGTSSESAFAPGCGVPTVGTRVPLQYVLAAGLDLLARWVEKHVPPPSAPPIATESSERP